MSGKYIKPGFYNNIYIEQQKLEILERLEDFDKVYIEFGGKLFDDYHAERVLPGYDRNVKFKILQELKDQCEVILCIYSEDIEKNKIHSDTNTPYERLILEYAFKLREKGIKVNNVVVTRYDDQSSIDSFRERMKEYDINVHTHRFTKGYPTDVDTIVSEAGYGQNTFVQTDAPVVVVAAPGPGSGKLATCLSQLYYEYKLGVKAGYAKFETFPVWDLSVDHPINKAYEAATIDLNDKNSIDPYHLQAYGNVAVNYNRDIESFPVLNRILTKIMKTEYYKSPTDMGINCISDGIVDKDICNFGAKSEIVRRYLRAKCDFKRGLTTKEAVERAKLIMDEVGIYETYLEPVAHSESNYVILSDQNDVHLYYGKYSNYMKGTAACILNTMKAELNIPMDMDIIPKNLLENVMNFRSEVLKNDTPLNVEEVLLLLSISAENNPIAKEIIDNLWMLKGCNAHSYYMVSKSDEKNYRKLGIELTADDRFYKNKNQN